MKEKAKDLPSLLAIAIYREQSARDLYTRLAKKIKNAGGKKTFLQLASDEGTHREKLEGWYLELFGSAFDFDLSKVEKIDFSIRKEAGAMDVLELALTAEQDAAQSYESMAQTASNEKFVELCQELAEQEWGHYATINAERQAVSGNFYWFDMDRTGFVED